MRDGAAPWGRLAWLAAGVLLVHLWWLQGPAAVVRPESASIWHTRVIAKETPAQPARVSRTLDTMPRLSPAKAPEKALAPADPPTDPGKIRSAEQGELEPRAKSLAPPVPPALASSAPASPAPASPTPAPRARLAYVVAPPARIHYKVTAQSRGTTLHGDSQLDWRHDGRTYDAMLQVELQSMPRRRQASSGAITSDGLAPQRFSERYRTEEATHFDHVGRRAIYSNNRPDTTLLDGAQDRLSAMLQLGAMLAASPGRYPPGTTVELQTASTREAQVWAFVVQGVETLVLPGGTVEALKLLRMPSGDYDIKVELWLAPGQAYGPVRLRLTQPNGDWVDHQWSSTDRG